ncbi:MAG: replication-relaxation family protein [Actinobacteria bacterium]|nr:replication-relaxation family protein [Actinomycetota bacterium]
MTEPNTGRLAARLAERPAKTPVRPATGGRSANDCLSSELAARSEPRRQRRSTLSRVAAELSERDWAILQSLGRVRLLTARQLERLHFREGSPLTQARRARRTLARLTNLQLLHRLDRRIGGLQAGSSGFIYGLSGWGQRLLSAPGPAGGSRRRREWEPSAAFQDHVLAVSELYVQLVEAATAGTIELLGFDAEPACWRSFQGLGGEALVLKPDAFVITAKGPYEYVSFVEVDRSTEGPAVLKRKAALYRTYWQAGGSPELDVFPQVVYLVPDARRLRAVAAVLGAVPDTSDLASVRLMADGATALSGDDTNDDLQL